MTNLIVILLFLALFFPVALNIFERHTSCFGHHTPHNEHVGHAHHGKEQEGASGGEVGKHPGGKLTNEVGTYP